MIRARVICWISPSRMRCTRCPTRSVTRSRACSAVPDCPSRMHSTMRCVPCARPWRWYLRSAPRNRRQICVTGYWRPSPGPRLAARPTMSGPCRRPGRAGVGGRWCCRRQPPWLSALEPSGSGCRSGRRLCSSPPLRRCSRHPMYTPSTARSRPAERRWWPSPETATPECW
jgi:hypothetical protein